MQQFYLSIQLGYAILISVIFLVMINISRIDYLAVLFYLLVASHLFQVPATIAYFFCAIFGFQILFGIVKIKKLDERERLITGTA